MWGYEGVTDMDIRRLLAYRVRRWRRARDQSTRDLSLTLGFAPNYVSELEHGQRRAPLLTLWTLAVHFGVTVDELLGPPRTREEHEWFQGILANRPSAAWQDEDEEE
ncbi:MAG: helix-turn-helix transcriptional regulator [Gemmatimonadaceae bacterium]|nr:helix-turn-helix transcriptional regulator [Gemmatimonadaceae bacterium]